MDIETMILNRQTCLATLVALDTGSYTASAARVLGELIKAAIDQVEEEIRVLRLLAAGCNDLGITMSPPLVDELPPQQAAMVLDEMVIHLSDMSEGLLAMEGA